MKTPFSTRSRHGLQPLLITATILVVLLVCLVGVMRLPAATQASGADVLRKVFGERVVAALETVLFKLEDMSKNMQYQLGMGKPASPWNSPTIDPTLTPGANPGTPAAPAISAFQATSTPQ